MLRYGITPIDEKNITSVFDKGKGIQSFLDLKFSDIVLDAAERGYKHCEITMDIFQILPIPINDEEIQKLKEIKKNYDLTYSAHFPIWSVDLSAPNKFIREASVESLIYAYNMFKSLERDIEVFVLHPTGALAEELLNLDIPETYLKIVTNLFSGFAIQGIKKIIKETRLDPSKIAIENIKFPFEGTLEIIKKIKGSGLCIDTAHFLGGYSGSKYSEAEALTKVTQEHLDKTIEIHLQDYSDTGGFDHAALGTGKFPAEFIRVIQNYNFGGPIVFELNYEQAFNSLEFIKAKTPEIQIPEVKP